MTDFITVADVDALLGPDWAGTGDPVLAVAMANAWLTAKINRPVADPTPEAIKLAGAQVAKEAAAGKLYTSTQKEVQSKTVSAQSGTSVSKTYVTGSTDQSAGVNFAMALLAPWIKRSGVMMLKRT
ncbi:Conserved hypothetical protein [Pseudomonas brassicacearum subsp. brassicacearum NFM421]|uniref:Protein singed n=1 Tax=Pseudomonas brassicacearum (strain NFM421) TaxID=994484 RepID=F2KJF6_PSEBN|nr:hypothetical protein [Pseudomonas brassicacearum]AEA70182.1 Conserved hypothetical protein [Pseudomonas brassicacearum subsp. brassicacearum NFM421]